MFTFLISKNRNLMFAFVFFITAFDFTIFNDILLIKIDLKE